MFSARTAARMADGYLPNMRQIYERIMNETRAILMNLEKRFQTFSQQQFIFVTALDRCRKLFFEPNIVICTIAQVYNYCEHVADNATDKRIFNIFLSLVRDLGEFRRSLMKLSKQSDDPVLTRIFSHWKRLLESRQNISAVRAKFPYSHVNHLSCDEAQNHFGGIVSVLPVAMEYAREAVGRIEVIRAYRIGNRNENEGVSSKPQRTRPHSSCPLSTPRSSANDGVPAGPACRLAQPNSPAVSSPVSSLSEASIRSYRTTDPPVCEAIKSSPRPSTALDTYIKESKARKTPNQSCPRYCAATQTPKCLASTLKPALNWPHRTISEEELKKMLKSRKHALTRPEWKP